MDIDFRITVLVGATAVYLLACIGIGWWANRTQREAKGADYFLAGGNLGPIVVSLTMMATVYSAWFILGHQGAVYQIGVPYVAYFCHQALFAFTGIFFFSRLWAVARRGGFVTMSEMYGTYYKSEFIRIIVCITGILYAIPYISLQLRGAGYVFNTLSGGVIDATLGTVIISAVVIFYVFFGGLKASAYVDTLQGFLLTIAAFFLGATVIVAVSGVAGDIGFFAQLKTGIMAGGDKLIRLPELGKMYSWPFILSFAIVCMGIYTSPPYMMIISAAKHPRVFRFQAFIIMALIMGFMYYVFSFFIGMGGRSILPSIPNTDALTLHIIFNYMGPFGFALCAIGILAAMNSTAAGYMANTSTILTRDLYKRYMNKDVTPAQEVWVSRFIVLILVMCAAVFSMLVLDYLTILGSLATSFGFQLFPAMLGVSYLPNLRGNAINAGIVVGLITTIITYFVIPYPLGIHMGGWGIIMNVLTIVIVQALTRDTATKPAVEYSHAMWDADIAREIGVAPLVDLKADPTDQNYGVSAKA